MNTQNLPEKIEGLLSSNSANDGLDRALRAIAEEFAAVTATLHRADSNSKMLHMVAHLGLPEKLVPITQHIPFGKGIAGLCAERAEPITVCNLQTDDSGAARPAAKQTGVEGAIAVPIFAPGDRKLAGTLGIGKPGEHTYTAEEQAVLAACAELLGRAITRD